jgi:hypothetical protein
VVFSVGPFDTSPTKNYTITVWTVNSGGGESNRVSDSATPYGPTLNPTGLSSSRSGTTITWQWNLPTNGRPISDVQVRGAVDQTFGSARTSVSFNGQEGRTYQLEVRANSAAGWSQWVGPDSQAIPNPPPEVYNVRKGPNRVDPGGVGSCTYSPGCPEIDFSIRNFPGNRTFQVDCESARAGGFVSASPLNTNASGDGYTWNGRCLFANGTGPVTIRVFGNGVSATGSAPW